MSTAYSEYVPKHERPVITALINAILNRGHTISVADPEEWVVKRSSKRSEIRPALGSSGEDVLRVRDESGEYVGFFHLIYDNGSAYDPMVVISDYTYSPEMEAIYDILRAKYG